LASWGTLDPGSSHGRTICWFIPAGLAASDLSLSPGCLAGAHQPLRRLCVGLASLMSWQGAAYALPVSTWLCCWQDETVAGGSVPRRCGFWCPWGLALVPMAVACLFLLADGPFTVLHRLAADCVREAPAPNFLPQRLSQWLALLANPHAILTQHGHWRFCHELGPSARDSIVLFPIAAYLGAGLLCLALSAIGWLPW